MKPQNRINLKRNRIRAFFLTLESDKKTRNEIEKDLQQFSEKGMVYIQMRLPVEQITEEFEKELKHKIEQSIIRANIREAKESDLEIIKDIYNKAWLTSNTPFRPLDIDTLDKIFDDRDTVFLIGRVYGQDSAFAILNFEGPNKEYAVIAGLGVVPKHQNKGLGKILGMALWKLVKENYQNIKELRAEVYKDNNISRNFIKSLGFEEFGSKTYRKEDFEVEKDSQ